MALNIRNRETEALAAELASLTGETKTEAIRRAWELHPDGTRRVWVHTRTLDAPGALPNYEARGLRVFDAAVEQGGDETTRLMMLLPPDAAVVSALAPHEPARVPQAPEAGLLEMAQDL